MKKFYLSFLFCLFSILSFASGETVVVVTNVGDGIAETPSELKPVNPCVTLLFKVNINSPQGFAIVAKYEWFVNGSLVLTNDTTVMVI